VSSQATPKTGYVIELRAASQRGDQLVAHLAEQSALVPGLQFPRDALDPILQVLAPSFDQTVGVHEEDVAVLKRDIDLRIRRVVEGSERWAASIRQCSHLARFRPSHKHRRVTGGGVDQP